MITIDLIRKKLNLSFKENYSFKLVKPYVYQIFLPYYHEDWDMIEIYFQFSWEKLILTDFWQTLMRLSYYTEIDSDTRKRVFENILNTYIIHNNDWKLSMKIDDTDDIFAYLMEFISAITKISDISFLKQERVRSLFYEYFEKFMINEFQENIGIKVIKDYTAPFDEKKDYPTPYAITKANLPPILYFPILNDDRCKDTIMTLLY